MLMGMQAFGNAIHQILRFPGPVDSQSTMEHYIKPNWQPLHAYVKFLPLVELHKIFLPPLHIKKLNEESCQSHRQSELTTS